MNIKYVWNVCQHENASFPLKWLYFWDNLKNNIIPPTINHETFDPEIDEKLNLTLNKAQKREVNYALCNTFGFGGHNASLLVKKYKE